MSSNGSELASTSSAAPWRRRLWIALPYLIVGGVAAIVFVNTLWNGFVFDDRVFIEKGKLHRSLSNIPRMFGLEDGHIRYRPFRQLTYAVDYAMFGLKPWGFHLSNLLYHVITSLLVLQVFRRLSGSRWIATVGALLFAAHPIHADAVTYISGRKDILTTMFTAGALLVYLQWRQSAKPKLLGTIVAAFGTTLLFVLGLLSKEMAVVLPVLVLLSEVALQLRAARDGTAPERSWSRLLLASLRRAAPVLAVLVLLAAGGCFYVVFFAKGTYQTWHGGSIDANFATVTRIQTYYAYLTTLPFRLVGDYYPETFPLSKGFLELKVLGSIAMLAALLFVLFRVARRAPLVWLGGLWFFACLLPVSQIVPHHELIGERFLYLSSIGFCLIAAVLLERLRTLRSERFALIAVTLLVCVFGGRLVWRNFDYRNDATFWASVAKAAPNNARAHVNIGYNYYYQGRVVEAAKSIEKGLEIDPKYWTGHYNLGRVYERLGRFTDAMKQYREELKYYESKDAMFNVANLLGRMGRIDEAALAFEEMVDRYRRNYEAFYYLGICYEKLADTDRAIECFRKAVSIHPTYHEAKARLRNLEQAKNTP